MLNGQSDALVTLGAPWTDLCISYFLPAVTEGKRLVTFSTPHLLPVWREQCFG